MNARTCDAHRPRRVADGHLLENLRVQYKQGKIQTSKVIYGSSQKGTKKGAEDKKAGENASQTPKMHVRVSKPFNVHNKQLALNEEGQNRKLREMMISKRNRRVYEKIRFGEKRKAREKRKLEEKRAKLDQTASN